MYMSRFGGNQGEQFKSIEEYMREFYPKKHAAKLKIKVAHIVKITHIHGAKLDSEYRELIKESIRKEFSI